MTSQQSWPGPPPPAAAYGQPPAYGQYPGYGPAPAGYGSGPGYGSPGFGPPSFGAPGMSPYGPPNQAPRPPARRGGARTLLLALVGVALVAMIGLALASFTSNTDGVAYQNDDYQVPPPNANPPPAPLPETYEEAEQFITASPLYGQTAPIPVRCTTEPINVVTASDRQLDDHFEGLMECLVRVWQPPVTGAGLEIVRPTVTIYGDSITTKCGSVEVNAFLCSADQQIYYSSRLPDVIQSVAENKWTADIIMAHEYGHLVQLRAGISVSAHALAQRTGSKEGEYAIVRRLETQADCFSGMFIRSTSVSLGVQQSDLQGILATYVAIGDDTLSGRPDIVGNHGLGRTREFWGNTGLRTSTVGDCNTFVAPDDQVR